MIDIHEVKLKTLANLPTRYGFVLIKPKSLLEVIDYGFNDYLRSIATVTSTIQQWSPNAEENDERATLQFLYELGAKDAIEIYLDSLSYLLDMSVGFKNGQICFDNKHELSFEQFKDILEIIKIQNVAKTVADEEDFNPLNDRVKKLKERIKKQREKVKSLKGNNDDGLTLFDLIEIYAASSNMNILEVFNMNYFQFNVQFNRLRMLNDYKVNINALMHDKIDPKKIEHWIVKAKDKN